MAAPSKRELRTARRITSKLAGQVYARSLSFPSGSSLDLNSNSLSARSPESQITIVGSGHCNFKRSDRNNVRSRVQGSHSCVNALKRDGSCSALAAKLFSAFDTPRSCKHSYDDLRQFGYFLSVMWTKGGADGRFSMPNLLGGITRC